MTSAPKIRIAIVASATRPRSARLILERKDIYILHPERTARSLRTFLSGAFANSWGECRDPVWGTGNRFIVHIADYELSKMSRDTLPGNETAVGADLSCAPPIYRPTRTLLCILAILFIVIIGPGSHPQISPPHQS